MCVVTGKCVLFSLMCCVYSSVLCAAVPLSQSRWPNNWSFDKRSIKVKLWSNTRLLFLRQWFHLVIARVVYNCCKNDFVAHPMGWSGRPKGWGIKTATLSELSNQIRKSCSSYFSLHIAASTFSLRNQPIQSFTWPLISQSKSFPAQIMSRKSCTHFL